MSKSVCLLLLFTGTISESLSVKREKKAQKVATGNSSPTLGFFCEQESGNSSLYHLLHGIKSWADNTWESISASEV